MHRSVIETVPRWTACLSSRLGSDKHLKSSWPWLLERFLRSAWRLGQTVLVTEGSTLSAHCSHLLQRTRQSCVYARIFNKPFRAMDAIPGQSTFDRAFTKWVDTQLQRNELNRLHVCYLPVSDPENACLRALPWQDRFAVCCSNTLTVLSMRSGGSIDRLISERVRDSRFKPATIRLYIDSSTCDVQSTLRPSRSRRRANMVRGANREDSQTTQWLDRGLVGWMTAAASRMVFDEPIGTCNSSQTTSGITTDWLYACGSAWSMMRPGDWLFHCVRGRTMGHCDTQAAHSVIDAVLRQHAREVSAYEVLLEIVRSKRLRGRKTLFRASSPCVSFSAVPLEELLRRRAYQSHLQRWDWEPYGLAVRRSALVALGTRPVIYGDEDDYSRLDESDRPFFQPAQRRQSNKHQANQRQSIKRQTNWTEEQEWRLVGDLPLARLPREAIVLFVANELEGKRLLAHSPWRVTWLQSEETGQRPSAITRPPGALVRTDRN